MNDQALDQATEAHDTIYLKSNSKSSLTMHCTAEDTDSA